MNILSGKKTYLCALGAAVVAAMQFLGYLDAEQANVLYGLLGAGGLASLRAGVAKK